MSAQIGGRSGNRGECAQTCRLKYKVDGDEGHHISPRDLMMLDHLDELIEIGVDSFKIEGRLKRPEYVYEVVSAYRKKIDAYFNHQDIDLGDEVNRIKKVFNREFTQGYLIDQEPDYINPKQPNHIGIPLGEVISTKKRMQVKLVEDLNQGDGLRFLEGNGIGFVANLIYRQDLLVNGAKKGDVIEFDYVKGVKKGTLIVKTTDSKQIKEVGKQINEITKKVGVSIKGEFQLNQPFKLHFSSKGKTVSVESDVICEKASSKGVDENRLIKQLSKLGDTIFYVEDINLEVEDNLFLPMSKLNQLRRDAVEQLFKVIQYDRRKVIKRTISETTKPELTQKLLVSYRTDEQRNVLQQFSELTLIDEHALVYSPRVNETDEYLIASFNFMNQLGDLLIDYKYCIASPYFNITNHYAIRFIEGYAEMIGLSNELDLNQIENVIKAYELDYKERPNIMVQVYGRIDNMVMKYPLSDQTNHLVDRKNERFDVYMDEQKITHILSHKHILWVKEMTLLKIFGVTNFYLRFTNEDELETLRIIMDTINAFNS